MLLIEDVPGFGQKWSKLVVELQILCVFLLQYFKVCLNFDSVGPVPSKALEHTWARSDRKRVWCDRGRQGVSGPKGVVEICRLCFFYYNFSAPVGGV